MPFGEIPPMVDKALAIDLLPLLLASKGWISDKPEGFAAASDGRVFVITGNDAVDDATGETLLLMLGNRSQLL